MSNSKLEKWHATIKLVAGAAFVTFGIWDYVFKVPEAAAINFIDALFVIIGAIIGAPGLQKVFGSSPLTKYKDTAKVAVALAIAIGVVWDYQFPFSGVQANLILDFIFSIIAAVIGVPPAVNLVFNATRTDALGYHAE